MYKNTRRAWDIAFFNEVGAGNEVNDDGCISESEVRRVIACLRGVGVLA